GGERYHVFQHIESTILRYWNTLEQLTNRRPQGHNRPCSQRWGGRRMPATMADKSKKRGRGSRPKGTDRHAEPRESFHLPRAMLDALTHYVDSARPPTTKSAVIRLALEEFLSGEGFWPPASEQAAKD